MLSVHRARSGSRSARGGASVAGRSGGRAVTKSWRGGGEAAELALPPPHPAREEEQFVYLGLQESFPPPCSPWPLLPALLFCALQPSPAGSALLLPSSPSPTSLSSPPLWPSLPSLLERGRGGGSGRRFVRLAALRSPGDRPAPPALPPPPPQATSAVGGRTRVPESSRELLAYKQEAPNHGHTGFFLIVTLCWDETGVLTVAGDPGGTSVSSSPLAPLSALALSLGD